MDIVAGHIYQWSLVQVTGGSQLMNVWDTECTGTFGSVSLENAAEAYWNHLKTDFRALYTTGFTGVFQALRWADATDPTGAFGEYSIPVGERDGTSTRVTGVDVAPTFLACGVRLTVGSRATRPGQKRFYGLTEYDVQGNSLTSAYLALANSAADALAAVAVLGTPAIGVELQTVVASRDETGALVTHQPVTGYVVNSYVTSQRSRRFGHGI